MLFKIKIREESEKLEEVVSLQNQVEVLRLQDKLGKQNCHENMKKVFEPATDTNKNTSEDITKHMMVISKQSNNTLSNLSNKLLELLNDRGVIASCLLSPLSTITNPEYAIQFKLVKVPSSNRVNDLLINKTIPVTLFNKVLTFRDTDKKCEIPGDILKMITNKNYNVDLASS